LDSFEELNEKYTFETYLETSSATGESVDDVFQAIANVIIDTTIEKKLNGPKQGTTIPK